MKIQCPCGAKFAVDVTPEMAAQPVQFVCPACGVDSSAAVNNLIRQELSATQEAQPGAPSPAPAVAQKPPSKSSSRLRVELPGHEKGSTPSPATAAIDELPVCAKHPGQTPVEKCRVCSKPLCPKCMELFGYVCSPACRAKAQAHGIRLPVYEHMSSVVEARKWKRLCRVAAAAGILLLVLLGAWAWYAAFGSRPRVVFSVRFDRPSYTGQSALGGRNNDQLVFLHGATLARHDLGSKKAIWSHDLLDHRQFEAQAAESLSRMAEAEKTRPKGEYSDIFERPTSLPSLEQMAQSIERMTTGELSLYVQGTNIWVSFPGKLASYDWGTGNLLREVPVESGFGDFTPAGGELLAMASDSGQPGLLHVDLATGEKHLERFDALPGGKKLVATAQPSTGTSESAPSSTGAATAGLPIGAGRAGGPMDPAKVESEASRLPLPARIALPALLAGDLNRERAREALDDTPRPSTMTGAGEIRSVPRGQVELFPTKEGCFTVEARLLESHVVQHSAMKPAPATSALNANLTAANSMEAASEVLNDIQRSRGGDVVSEDLSRYSATLRRLDQDNSWTGEVIGSPAFFPLQTVNVLAANNKILVFDKSNKQLWQAALSYNVLGGPSTSAEADPTQEQGPCVERPGSLYVFDEGVLTAFDLATGTVRWRLPTIGITGLLFDDADHVYVNSTTAGLDKLKYSRQIDLSQDTHSVVFKLNCRDGAVLWKGQFGGAVQYVSGKFVYMMVTFMAEDPEASQAPITGFEPKSYLRIKRINPRDGSEMWDHFQQRSPLDVRFDQNAIRLVFKNEVQVLNILQLLEPAHFLRFGAAWIDSPWTA